MDFKKILVQAIAVGLFVCSATIVVADWKIITDFEGKDARLLTGWNVEQDAGILPPVMEVVDVADLEGEGNDSQQCLELVFKSPGTWSKVNYNFPVETQFGEEYDSENIKLLVKGDGTNQSFNLRLMESTACLDHPGHPALVYVPNIPLANSGWEEVIFELTPDVFVPHGHTDGNNDIDWPIVGLVVGVSGATTTFYIDEVKVGSGEDEVVKAISSSGKLATRWGDIKAAH